MRREGFHPINLSVVYHTLLEDTGIEGVRDMAHSICLPRTMAKASFYNHARIIYKLTDESVSENMVLVHNAVRDFIKRHNLGKVEIIAGKEVVSICMVTDGTYDSMGHNATHGASFAFERYTGAPLAVMMAEKCRTCADRDVHSTKGRFPKGKFHGYSGDMEKFNILRLFENSLSIGFKYTSVVMDGDIQVMPALKQLRPYGPELPDKVECRAHLCKKAFGG